jgi:hypothetical protein
MNRHSIPPAAGLPGKPDETIGDDDSGESPGLEEDKAPDALQQDTPGRPKSASSRQQTQPGQSTQTGNAAQDAKNARRGKGR